MEKDQYKVLVANGSSNLSSQVTLHIHEGWLIVGGVSVTSYYDKDDKLVFQYVQALVKYGE